MCSDTCREWLSIVLTFVQTVATIIALWYARKALSTWIPQMQEQKKIDLAKSLANTLLEIKNNLSDTLNFPIAEHAQEDIHPLKRALYSRQSSLSKLQLAFFLDAHLAERTWGTFFTEQAKPVREFLDIYLGDIQKAISYLDEVSARQQVSQESPSVLLPDLIRDPTIMRAFTIPDNFAPVFTGFFGYLTEHLLP